MKTLLEAIQAYPEQFISTCRARAETTPSLVNSTNHQFFAIFIDDENWNKVAEMLEANYYRSPLDGVIICLDTYSEIDNTAWHQIVELFKQEKFV